MKASQEGRGTGTHRGDHAPTHPHTHAARRGHSQHVLGTNVTAWAPWPHGEPAGGEKALQGSRLLKKSFIISCCQLWIY